MFSGWIENPKHCNDRIRIILSETAGEFTESGKSERSFQDGRRIIIRTRKPMVMYMISASLHRVRLITDHQVPVQNILSFRSKASKTIRADRRRQAARFARLASGTHAGGTRIS